MTGRFELYNVVLIDSSLFPRTLSDELINGLKSIKNVYVTGTFHAETSELMELLSPADKANCENNLRLLNTIIHPKEMNLSEFPDMNCDVWDFLALSATRPNADKMLIITANQALIQRVVCSRFSMDIYDLNKSCFISHKDYRTLDKEYSVDNNDKPVCDIAFKGLREGARLYAVRREGKINETVTLGSMLGDGTGGEGNVYHLTGRYSNEVAKILKSGQFPGNKYLVTTEMVRNPRFGAIEWTEFPTGILYADAACTQPVGIMERYTETHSSLYDDELFFGDTGNWSSALLSVRVVDLLYLCKCITRQICFLNMLGVLVGDYNIKNFDYPASLRSAQAGHPQNGVCRYIQMWDSDSFGYNNYFSGYMADVNCKHYDITRRLDILNLCNDELYTFLFQILTLGDNPYNPVTGRFNYEDENYGEYARREFVPKSIWNAFERFFTGKSTSSPQMMLYLLHNELKKREASPEIDITYKDIVGNIDVGFFEEQDRVLPAVYSPALNIFPKSGRVEPQNTVPPQKVAPPQRVVPPQKVVPPQRVVPPQMVVPPQRVVPPQNKRQITPVQPKKSKRGLMIAGIVAGSIFTLRLLILLFFFI